jgi:hypothetical protein
LDVAGQGIHILALGRMVAEDRLGGSQLAAGVAFRTFPERPHLILLLPPQYPLSVVEGEIFLDEIPGQPRAQGT